MQTISTVNERTSSIITVAFFDEDDDPVTPSSATYRIDDITNGIAILAATDITGLSTTVDLIITSDQNAIIDEDDDYELRRITVDAIYSTDRHMTDEYFYKIKNLGGVTT